MQKERIGNSTPVSGRHTVAQGVRPLPPKATELLQDRQGPLPVWVRAPKFGQEYYSGLGRAKLYELAGAGKIRSVSIREPGKVKGCRLFHLRSILDFIAKCEQGVSSDSNGGRQFILANRTTFTEKEQNDEQESHAQT